MKLFIFTSSFTVEEADLNNEGSLRGETATERAFETLVHELSKSNDSRFAIWARYFSRASFGSISRSKGDLIAHVGSAHFPSGAVVGDKVEVRGEFVDNEEEKSATDSDDESSNGEKPQTFKCIMKVKNRVVAEITIVINTTDKIEVSTDWTLLYENLADQVKPVFKSLPYTIWELSRLALDHARDAAQRLDKKEYSNNYNFWGYPVNIMDWKFLPPSDKPRTYRMRVYQEKKRNTSRIMHVVYTACTEIRDGEDRSRTEEEDFAIFKVVVVRWDKEGNKLPSSQIN